MSPPLHRTNAHPEQLALAPSLSAEPVPTQETLENLQLVCKEGVGVSDPVMSGRGVWDSGSVIRARSQRRLAHRLPPIVPTPSPAGRVHLPWPSFPLRGHHHTAWPSPHCVAALARPPRMTGGRRGPGMGLRGEILVKHFRLHPPPGAALDHWRVGQSPPDRRAQSSGVCVSSLHACFPVVSPSPGWR